MKTYEELLDELDADQRRAACWQGNAVVAAGAGSGKTRVLASRYVHLIVEKGLDCESILALTFTKKAANEMYSRIYSFLKNTDHPLARKAAGEFHLARIQTLDSFCNTIARTACRAWGISPDFRIDDEKARTLAEESALSFLLEHRSSAAIRQLLKKTTIQELPVQLFAETMIRHAPVTSPPDFTAMFEKQETEISRLFGQLFDDAYRILARLGALRGGSGSIWDQIQKALQGIPERPEPHRRDELATYLAFSSALAGIKLMGNAKKDVLVECKSAHKEFKEVHANLLSVVNFLLNRDTIKETFQLLQDFCTIYNKAKREQGVLTFTDVSRLALDALQKDPEVRHAWKTAIQSIMIDEFQDNNELQRDLLFLLAENRNRTDKEIPQASELCPDKLFFVGDEKQSIYRFRGADVAVFRSLSRDVGQHDIPRLETNYRTEKKLISVFNTLFPHIFRNPALCGPNQFPEYEAEYAEVHACHDTAGLDSPLTVMLVPKHLFSVPGSEFLSPRETEIAAVAGEISRLLKEQTPVRGKEGLRPCTADDIAILLRTGSQQALVEKHLTLCGIPYQSESLRGLFADAPINDMYALLRLAVYPHDTHAYAVLLRSPLVAVSDRTVWRALAERAAADSEDDPSPPFPESLESDMDSAELASYRSARTLYQEILNSCDRVPITALLTDIWYYRGYRHAILHDSELHRYSELYDYFFELARRSDERGETLACFLDRVFQWMQGEEKLDSIDIPVERSGGVRILTIHKSKGLEFPVVFIVDAANKGNADKNNKPVYFSADFGVSINTGAAEEAEDARSNWFYEKGREEERLKTEAELRRLLYVAMTRAECRLYISSVLDSNREPDDIPETEEDLRELLEEIQTRREEKELRYASFLHLLLPALCREPVPGVSLRAILPVPSRLIYTNSQQNRSRKTAEMDTAYATAEHVSRQAPPRTRVAVTEIKRLYSLEAGNEEKIAFTEDPSDELDRLLKRIHMDPAVFGTHAHRAIEGRFTGNPWPVPPEIHDEVALMADRFFASELGQLALQADSHESEFGFISRQNVNGRDLILSGSVDLLFRSGGTLYIVDYKTDKTQNPAEHSLQLTMYSRALGELYGTQPEAWLFYLRSGNAVKITEDRP